MYNQLCIINFYERNGDRVLNAKMAAASKDGANCTETCRVIILQVKVKVKVKVKASDFLDFRHCEGRKNTTNMHVKFTCTGWKVKICHTQLLL